MMKRISVELVKLVELYVKLSIESALGEGEVILTTCADLVHTRFENDTALNYLGEDVVGLYRVNWSSR